MAGLPRFAGALFASRASIPGVDRSRQTTRRDLPPWLIGLLIAVVVFAGVLFAFHILGFGDNPVVEGATRAGPIR